MSVIKKIVTIGGGTGSYTLLKGLKNYSYDLTSIVTMADDGGSTGTLRDELGVLPPGDVRQCLVALSDSSLLMRNLMTYRFENGDLKGHSFGNLLLSALEKITGDFSTAIEEAGRILNTKGKVLPVSENDMRLKIILNDNTFLDGEKELDDNEEIRKKGIKDIKLSKNIKANKKAVNAILDADYIIIGPGDHYGSILPNLLVREISQAINKTKANVFFISPLTNKMGHSDNFGVIDYVQKIEKYIGTDRVDSVFYNSKNPNKHVLKRYEEKEGSNSFVLCNEDDKNFKKRKFKLVKGDYLLEGSMQKDAKSSDAIAHTRSFIRHDSNKLAHAISFTINNENVLSSIEII